MIEGAFAALSLLSLYVALIVGLTVVIVSLGRMPLPDSPATPFGDAPPQAELIMFITLALVAAPVVEEVFFRGLLYNALRTRLGVILAALIQAAIFGLLHPYDLGRNGVLVLVGLAAAAIYEWRKTLLAPILFHALVNVVGTATMLTLLAIEANAPVLGVYAEAKPTGARIETVTPGSTADEAGLRVADTITAIGSQPVKDLAELRRAVRRWKIGDDVSVDYERDGQKHRVVVRLKGRPK